MVKGILILHANQVGNVYPQELREILSHRVSFIAPPQTAQEIEDNPSLLNEVEVIFSSWGMVKLDEHILAHAPKLKAVFYGAGSIRYFTTPAMWQRGIRVSSAYHVNGEYVANFTLAQILLSLKGYWSFTRQYREHRQTWQRFPVAGMYHSTVGIISLGAIGVQVARLLQPFDINVIAYDPFWHQDHADRFGTTLVPLDTLFATADVVSLHTPWLPETEGMITGSHIRKMKPHAVFINTARGAVVRENELIAVLMERPDLTALLDVTYPEPPAADSPLFDLPNVILSPHIAGAMDCEIQKMGQLMVEEFLRWQNGDPMQYEITEVSASKLA
jgi:phosphoglycerate dehydrogenase-like enzyme